ncbi:MAG: protein kinase [Sandaracinaceae bacterium]|nr:protein kinase [Sandaracinaceae bacterium]
MAELVGGRFELLARAGAGGMGEVWKARDLRTDRTVALKRILRDDGDVARFSRESRLLERVRHPALVGHVEHGEHGGRPYLVMEWVEGEALDERLTRAPLSLADSLTVMGRIAGALDALHAQGVVHRDVKPANIMLAGGNPAHALLLDLGIARHGQATAALTAANLIVGTLGYMAPEQARAGHPIDPRADVFALGCVLFECLTGEPAFRSENPIGLLAQLIGSDARRVRSLRPELAGPLDDLVAAMLSRSLDGRPRDGAAILRALSTLDAPSGRDAASVPRATPALSGSEQRFVLAAVLQLGDAVAEEDATLGVDDANAEMTGLAAAVATAGGQLVPLSGTVGLVSTPDGRGTVADRVHFAAEVLRGALAAVPDARAGLSAGLSTTQAGAPAGMVLTRAAELAQRVAGGEIGIDETVRELIADRFEATDGRLGPPRVQPALATPFVGRTKELRILEATLEEVLDEAVPRAVLVTAPPGAGKTRLGRELALRLAARDDVRVVIARAEVTSAGSPHALTRALVRTALGLGPRATASDAVTIRDRLTSLPGLDDAGRTTEFLCELVGAPLADVGVELAASRGDPELTRRWIRQSVREWLAAECAREPLALLFEDLHWSDELAVSQIGDALRALDGSPLFIVALARPEVADLLHDPWPHTLALTLSALSPRAAEQLVRDALGDAAPDEVVARVVDRGAGSPLFLEELSRFVRERRVDDLPPSVAAILHARIEALSPDQRRALRAASVLGDRFASAPVAAIAGEPVDEVERTLASLCGRGLVEASDDRWTFHHALVRETALETLSPADARVAHARAADWLEATEDPDPTEMLRHASGAGDEAREALWLVRAAERAAEAGADEEAWALAGRGIELSLTSEQEGRLRTWYAQAFVMGKNDPRLGLEHAQRATALLVPSDSAYSLALGICAWSAASLADMPALIQAVSAWQQSGIAPQTRVDGYALAGMIAALSHVGLRDIALALSANAAALERPASAAWLELMRAGPPTIVEGRRGVGHQAGARALAHAERVGDDAARIAALAFHFGASFGLASAELHGALTRAMSQVADVQNANFHTYLEVYAAAMEIALHGRGRELLEQRGRGADLVIAEMARMGVALSLWDAPADELEAALDVKSFVLPSWQSGELALRAWVAVRRGDFEGTLRRCDRAGAATRAAAGFAWAPEIVHLCRVEALIELDRHEEAVAELGRAGDRLAVTLAGAGAALLDAAESGSPVVRDLRAAAGRLGLTLPSIHDLVAIA